MPDEHSSAIEAITLAREGIAKTFLPGTGEGRAVQPWLRARMDWDDEVASSTEEQFFKPLSRDAEALHQALGELAMVLGN